MMSLLSPILRTAAFLIAAIALFWSWRRPKRKGDSFHCGTCDYQIVGDDLSRCPECGDEVTTESLVRGTRQFQPWRAWAGLGCIAISIMIATNEYRNFATSFRTTSSKPLTLLFADLLSESSARAQFAASEIQQRCIAAPERVFDVRGLLEKRLGDNPASAVLRITEYDMYYKFAHANKIGVELDQALVKWMSPVYCDVPPLTCVDEPVSVDCWIDFRTRRFGKFEIRRLMIDGKLENLATGWKSFRNRRGSAREMQFAEGAHEVTFDIDVSAVLGDLGYNDVRTRTIPYAQRSVAKVETVPMETYLERLEPLLSSFLQPDGYRISLANKFETRWSFVSPSPVDSQLHVSIVVDGRVISVGRASIYRGQTHSFVVEADVPKVKLPKSASIRAILVLTSLPKGIKLPADATREFEFATVPLQSDQLLW